MANVALQVNIIKLPDFMFKLENFCSAILLAKEAFNEKIRSVDFSHNSQTPKMPQRGPLVGLTKTTN